MKRGDVAELKCAEYGRSKHATDVCLQETRTHKNATAAKITPGLKKERAAFQTRDEHMWERGGKKKTHTRGDFSET